MRGCPNEQYSRVKSELGNERKKAIWLQGGNRRELPPSTPISLPAIARGTDVAQWQSAYLACTKPQV